MTSRRERIYFPQRFAILGANKSLDHGLGIYLGIYTAIAIGLTTAGGAFIDLCSDVTPEVLRACEHVLTTAVLAATTYVSLAKYELTTVPAFPVTLIAALIAFAFRLVAVREPWGQIVPNKPPGVRAA